MNRIFPRKITGYYSIMGDDGRFYTAVTTADTKPNPEPKRKRIGPIRYYWRVARWMWKHRYEQNCRQKWRRMDREINVRND